MAIASKPRWLTKIVEALAVPENKGKVGKCTSAAFPIEHRTHCSQYLQTVYQVATFDSQNIPHVRTQVHRGFLIPKSAPSLPLLVTSSDVRSPKVTQILSNASVELCWWLEGSQDQFRISGKAKVIPSPDNALGNLSSDAFSLAANALDESGEADREDGNDNRVLGKYDWEKKRQEVFDAMKPAMKASWCAPKAPGSRMASYDVPVREGWPTEVPNKEDLKTEEERRNYEVALGNFAMVVVEPTRVDWVQLGERPNRRTLFTRKDEQGGSFWEEEILVP